MRPARSPPAAIPSKAAEAQDPARRRDRDAGRVRAAAGRPDSAEISAGRSIAPCALSCTTHRVDRASASRSIVRLHRRGGDRPWLTWLALTEGTAYGGVTIGAWTAWPKNGTPGIDPYARAIVARTGELPVGSGDGVAFYAFTDDRGSPSTDAATSC